MNNIKTVIHFGGFYDSVHSDNIDSMIDGYYSDIHSGDSLDYSNLDIPYSAIKLAYCKNWGEGFKRFINDECNIDVNFSNISIRSPREYNFQTDQILCEIGKGDETALIKSYSSDPDFIGYLREATVSKSGYISFYNYTDAMANKDNIFTAYLFEYLAELFNKNEFESFYDRYCMYELLYDLDMPQLQGIAS